MLPYVAGWSAEVRRHIRGAIQRQKCDARMFVLSRQTEKVKNS